MFIIRDCEVMLTDWTNTYMTMALS